MKRDQLKAEFRELVKKSGRAIDEGFEPGIGRMLDGMADVAERHAIEAVEEYAAIGSETPDGETPTPKAAPRRTPARRSTAK